MFIDTHCHLHDEKLIFNTDRIVEEYLRDGVEIAINAGVNLDSSTEGKMLAEKYPSVYFMAGYHPSDSDSFSEKEFDKILSLTSHKKCLAVGEIGLDYYWKPFDREKQIRVFTSQIDLANSCSLPISIHCRDATLDTLSILKQNKGKLKNGAVMHCYSGSVETAKELLDLGVYISFAGPLTFKNAKNTVEVAKYLPNDMCLTETDSPYLAPHPLRGRVNEPKNVSLITAFLAEIKNLELQEMAKIIMANAKRLFKKL